MMVRISVESVVISPLSFFIATIWLFSLFFYINLASGLSISLIFSKNQLLDLLIFFERFFVSLSFSSALILVISSPSFYIFFHVAPLILSILMIGYQF